MGICAWVRGLFRPRSSRKKRYSVASNISMSVTSTASGSSPVRYDPTPPRLDLDPRSQPSLTSTPTQASSCLHEDDLDRDVVSESALYFEGPLHDTSSSCLSDLSFVDDEDDELFPANDPRLQLSFSAPAGCILAESFGSGGKGAKGETRRKDRRKKYEPGRDKEEDGENSSGKRMISSAEDENARRSGDDSWDRKNFPRSGMGVSKEEAIQNLESSRHAKRKREIVEVLVEEGIFNLRQAERIMLWDPSSTEQLKESEPTGISKVILHGKNLLKASTVASTTKMIASLNLDPPESSLEGLSPCFVAFLNFRLARADLLPEILSRRVRISNSDAESFRKWLRPETTIRDLLWLVLPEDVPHPRHGVGCQGDGGRVFEPDEDELGEEVLAISGVASLGDRGEEDSGGLRQRDSSSDRETNGDANEGGFAFYSFCFGRVVLTSETRHCSRCHECFDARYAHCDNCDRCSFGLRLGKCVHCGKREQEDSSASENDLDLLSARHPRRMRRKMELLMRNHRLKKELTAVASAQSVNSVSDIFGD